MNLLTVLKDNLTDTVVTRAAYYVEENPEKTRTALEGLVYTVVAGLMKRTTSEIGVNQLFNQVEKGKYDRTLATSLGDVLADPEQTSRLTDDGNYSISHLLPAMKSSVGTMISSYANIKNSAAITLLGIVTPMVLATLHQIVKDKKLDADSLAALLADQRDPLIEGTPERLLDRMGESLGIRQLLAAGVTPAKRTMLSERSPRVTQERTRFAPEPEEENNGSLAKWGVGALLLLVLAAGGYYIWSNTQNYSAANENEEAALSTDLNDSLATTPRPDSTARLVNRTESAALTELTTYVNDPQAQAGRLLSINALSFETGTVTLKASAQTALNELINLMKARPTMQIQFVGYATDAEPPMTNKQLSVKRVYLLKKQVLDGGIENNRVDAIGLGTGFKRSTSDSTAARSRVEIKVITK